MKFDFNSVTPAVYVQADLEEVTLAACLSSTYATQMPSPELSHEFVSRMRCCVGSAEFQRLKPIGRTEAKTEPHEDQKASPWFPED